VNVNPLQHSAECWGVWAWPTLSANKMTGVRQINCVIIHTDMRSRSRNVLGIEVLSTRKQLRGCALWLRVTTREHIFWYGLLIAATWIHALSIICKEDLSLYAKVAELENEWNAFYVKLRSELQHITWRQCTHWLPRCREKWPCTCQCCSSSRARRSTRLW
jgi:hypothetical protein